MSEITQEEGLTRRNRIRVLKKHVYANDPNVSLKALDQTWKLDRAYIENHVNLNISYEDYRWELGDLDREIEQL